ncbi:MAG TPA: helix-turn-helix domain-containing protein [Rhizobiaceae bacterium]|nr:helix-turn-helix domain-containing protein [Rhizobiaceae bacterium]
MDEFGKLLSVQEVCEYLGVSRTTIYFARREGDFAPEIRIGGRIVFAERQLVDWLRSRQGVAQAAA